jgi:microcystin-dependent protein
MPIGLNSDTQIVDVSNELFLQVGAIFASARIDRPDGFLICDGSTWSRTTYSRLFNVIVPNKGAVTITITSPGIVTLNGHGFLTGESIYLTTTGSLPTGLTQNILYFVRTIDTNTFHLYDTYVNATTTASTTGRVNTSGSQSGTHTLFACPYGLGNGSTTFNIPDFKNATVRGRGLSTGFTSGNNLTTSLGYLEEDRMQGHEHSTNKFAIDGNSGGHTYPIGSLLLFQGFNTSGRVSDGTNGTPRIANETRMKNQGVKFFIKF